MQLKIDFSRGCSLRICTNSGDVHAGIGLNWQRESVHKCYCYC